jgi:TonB-linked SusC/RagA family outer membrane protein
MLAVLVVTPTRIASAQANRSITGTVVDNDGGAPIAGATVQVKDTPALTATTGADGAFEIKGAPLTDVTLTITAPDYGALDVKVKAAKTASTIAIYASKKAAAAPTTRTVTGVVHDATTNQPLAGATVKVQGTTIQAEADTDGLFVIDKAPAGDITLEATAPDHQPITLAVSATTATARVALASLSPQVAPPPPQATTRTVRGRISDGTTNDPIIGATVTVQGTANAALTDENGMFVLNNVKLTEAKLDVVAAGYKDLTVTALATVNDVAVGMELATNEQVFIESRAPVIVKQNLANGASSINGEDLNRVSAPTLDSAMEGKVSGANLQYNSGAPGGGAQLRLRGVSTINGQSSPLYVIDGIIVSNVAIPSGANALTGAAAGGSTSNQDNPVNRISDINPNDIENVEILKGAAAAALYGSKAANGVVIITTKHGRGGKSQVTATQRVGFSTVSNTLGSRTFTSASEVADTFKNNPDAIAAFNQGKTFDHEAELIQTKLARETVVSATGGTEKAGYFGSVLLRDEPGVLINTDYSKQSGRLGAYWDFANRLRVSATANVIHTSADRGLTNNDNTGISTYVVLSSTPSFFDLNRGSNGLFPVNPFVGSGANPLQTQQLLVDNEDVWRVLSATNASLKVIDDKHQTLTIQGGFGFDRFHQVNTLFSPPELNYEGADGLLGTSIDGETYNLNANVGLAAIYTYEPENEKWKSATSVGLTYETVDLANDVVVAQNLTAGQQNVGSGTAISVQQQRLRTHDQGFYVQEEVAALDKKLSLLAGLLAERSSLNGDPDHLYVFPKFAATYEIPQKAFDTLRVRAAVGEAGNRPNYGQKFTPENATTNIGGNAGITITGLTGAIAGDPNIKPERQLEIEGGVDMVFKDQRAVLELTGYQRTISDLLLQRTLAPSTGFAGEFFNGGELRNRGIEASLQVIPVAKPLEWVSRFVFTLNRSEITSLPVPTFDISTVGFGAGLGAFRIEQGQSATQIVGTIDGNGTIAKLGDGEPDFRLGWSNNFKYKNYGLTTLLDWQQGSSIINLTRLLYDGAQNSSDYVAAGADRFKTFASGDIRPYIEDASFLKLREVSLYWQVPTDWAHQLMLQSARVSLSGRNLLTFTHYSGLDPEVSNFGNQAIGRNYDVAPFPPSRSFWLSVDAGF